MQDPLTILRSLKRPRLLIRAARFGADDYSRERHLTRLFGSAIAVSQNSGATIMRLIELEQELDEQRDLRDAGYSLTRHLDVLIALIAEARLLQAIQVVRA